MSYSPIGWTSYGRMHAWIDRWMNGLEFHFTNKNEANAKVRGMFTETAVRRKSKCIIASNEPKTHLLAAQKATTELTGLTKSGLDMQGPLQ